MIDTYKINDLIILYGHFIYFLYTIRPFIVVNLPINNACLHTNRFFCPMIDDPKLRTAKKLISLGEIKNLSELLEIIKPTPLATLMKTGHKRLKALIENPVLFMFEDAYTIADLLGVPREDIIKIIHQENLDRSQKKKNRKN